MARLPRLVVPNQPHHIVQSGNDRQPVFRDDQDRLRFLGWLKQSARQYKVAIHAYALTPEQVHLLASPPDEAALAQMMQRIGRYYVPWFNAKYGRCGTLFQGRFKTAPIEAQHYLLVCTRYIEQLALRSAQGQDGGASWSSYSHHAGGPLEPLITDHALYWALGNTPFAREAVYIELFAGGLSASEIVAIEAAVLKGWPLGSDAYKAELQRRAKRQVLPAKRGRPFKIAPPAA
jgi:putative transposase